MHDAENSWEWLDGRSSNGLVGFNICRHHDQARLDPLNPVQAGLLVYDEQFRPDELGQWLADQLVADVHTSSCCDRPNVTFRASSKETDNHLRFFESQSDERQLMELFESLAAQPSAYLATVSVESVQSFFRGLSNGFRLAGISYLFSDSRSSRCGGLGPCW